MRGSSYPFARSVAQRAARYLTDNLAAAGLAGSGETASSPDIAAMEAMIDAAFWASLRREEGYSPKISLAYLRPAPSSGPLMLERPLPLAPEELTRLAPAVERPGIHLGVWPIGKKLTVWGAIRRVPPFCFVLEVVSPSVLVIKFSRREESNKFVNFAVLESDQVKMLSPDVAGEPDSPALLKSLLGFGSLSAPTELFDTFAKLAVSMRIHGRGGSLLIVPARTEVWLESLVRPIRYSIKPEFMRLAELIGDPASERQSHLWQERFQRLVDSIAGLTAVDGATVITDQYEVLAFGANIRRRVGATQVDHVRIVEPLEGSSPQIVHVSDLGGTRHLSAAQFVHDQHHAFALVASQDGRFSLFAWCSRHKMVEAYRIETFLM
jgi:hypothetical protein